MDISKSGKLFAAFIPAKQIPQKWNFMYAKCAHAVEIFYSFGNEKKRKK